MDISERKMDRKLFDVFREKVNEHDLVFQMYHDRNGKDQWSIICSAMDWIEVVIDEIDEKKLFRENDNASSVKIMTFINCIDVLWEAIQQLHRVFFATSSIPFAEDESAFLHKLFHARDNEYFKTIRACFSAHPVNLRDNFSGNGQSEQRYASWSGGGFGNGDFSVILYSNRVGYDAIILDIYFEELICFAQKRYKYLKNIMDEIDRQITRYKFKWSQREILRVKSPKEQIKILVMENEQRLGNEYYSSELRKLQIIFDADVTDEQNSRVLEKYRKELMPVIDELHYNLQTMIIEELKTSSVLDQDMPNDLLYEISTLCDMVYGNGTSYPIMLSRTQERLQRFVDLSKCKSYNEVYALVIAGFFELNRVD